MSPIHRVRALNGISEPVEIVVRQLTWDKIQDAVSNGATIVVNKSWDYTGRARGFSRVERLAQSNSRKTGRPEHIVWACWK